MADWAKKGVDAENTNVDSGPGSKSGSGEHYSLPEGKSEGSAPGGKETSEFAKGGDTPMFGEQNANEQKPGTTRHDTSPMTGPGDKFAKGGSQKMFGYAPSEPARSGITSAR